MKAETVSIYVRCNITMCNYKRIYVMPNKTRAALYSLWGKCVAIGT